MGAYSEKEEKTFRENLMRSLTKQDTILERIETQVLKTNGRVNKHDWYFTALWWGAGILGGGLIALLVYTIPIIFNFMQTVRDLGVKVALLESKNNSL